MNEINQCPGCGSDERTEAWRLTNLPVVMNYRFPDKTSALQVPRGEVSLRQCLQCGLVYNSLFDAQLVPYDAQYDNRQSCSGRFQTHLDRQSRSLARRLQTHAKSTNDTPRVLEVGCGKGDFLKLLMDQSPGVGIGYDSSYDGSVATIPGKLEFYPRYVGAGDVEDPITLIICRHVIEHVSDVGSFLKELAGIAEAGGDPLVVLETPRFEWIVENGCLWDVFYEHCNYFTMPTLAHLCWRAGFRVVRHIPVFGDQYQWIELRRDPNSVAPDRQLPVSRSSASASANTKVPSKHFRTRSRRLGRAPRIRREGQLMHLAQKATKTMEHLADCIAEKVGSGDWAIWGAGAKGVCLVHHLAQHPPLCVVDSNPAKQSCVIPGSEIPIVAPNDPALQRCKLVLVANPNYLREISAGLKLAGFAGHITPA